MVKEYFKAHLKGALLIQSKIIDFYSVDHIIIFLWYFRSTLSFFLVFFKEMALKSTA